jgi:glycosyltransferase involved in cell wall biosynthesis
VNEIVIPYGTFALECDKESAAGEFLQRWPLLHGKRIAITLGRIHPKKGCDILIEAFAGALADDGNWHLVIAGPDDAGWKTDLESLAMRLGIQDRITWTGMLKGTLKWGALAASEIFVLPSHQENFGIAVAEALSCSLPVVISDKVNIWREISAYNAGLIGEDTPSATCALLKRWTALTAEEIANARINSRKCFDEKFNMDVTRGRYLSIVESLVR